MKMQFFMCLKLFPFFVLLSSFVGAVIDLPENATIPAVVFFGDSVVDTGNNNYIITTFKSNFRPYGKNFMGGKPTGRFSDGKVPSDLFAEELGTKQLLPPFLDPSLQSSHDLLTGVNFASAGSGYDTLTANLTLTLSLPDQLDMFKKYIVKLKEIAGEERSSTLLRESLIVVVTGTNDIWNTYSNVRHLQYDASSYTDLLVSYASDFAQNLYRLGARRIGIFGLPPIGCLPSLRTLKGGLERKCADEYNEIAQLFNNKLSAEIASLNTQFPDANIVYIDFYNHPLDIMTNPQKYGFKITDTACCGTGLVEAGNLCRFACSNVDDHLFWDVFHPTEKAYRILVRQMLEKYISYFICGKSLC